MKFEATEIASIANGLAMSGVSRVNSREGETMDRCFTIQPFDSKFDKRFDDVFAPAVRSAGLEPYRVDRDPGVIIPIDDISVGISSSLLCLADITTDNPNVWFELGYAIASRREVVLVCSDERDTAFPFDVQHRAIIKYKTDSVRDFEELKAEIEGRIKAMLQRRDSLEQLATIQSINRVEGLEQYQIATLVAVAEYVDSPQDRISAYQVRQAMEQAGFTKVATTLGLTSLSGSGMLDRFDEDGYDGRFTAYQVSERGMRWLLDHAGLLTLEKIPVADTLADDMPF